MPDQSRIPRKLDDFIPYMNTTAEYLLQPSPSPFTNLNWQRLNWTKEELSSKAHFQVSAGMTNLGKTFFCYARWRHKTNPAILSPWTNLMQIIIS